MIERNNVRQSGRRDGPAMVFVHGFGCDQTMWRDVTPAFADTHHVVTYDLTGMGASDRSAYDPQSYRDLNAHADDLLGIIEALDLSEPVVVGHSVGATIAVLAANRAPGRIGRLVLVSPTPSFLDDDEDGYRGGFSRAQIDELIDFLDGNHLGWSQQMAPVIVGRPAGEPKAEELTRSFCQTDPAVARHFGRVTFMADAREDMRQLATPSLVLHCNEDALVSMTVADWMRDNIPQSDLVVIEATGHCPHMTVPDVVNDAMRAYLG